jgi:hypothetical protein
MWFLRARPLLAAALAIALLPLLVGFFHEHDFTIVLIPVVVLALRGDGRVRTLTGIAAACTLVDWFGIAQRPAGAAQTVCLALALGCTYAALPAREDRAAATALVAAAIIAPFALALAHAHPAPVWPDALGNYHAAAGLDASAVWAAEQQRSGLQARVPAWGVLRAIPLAGCVLVAAAATLQAMTMRSPRTATGTGSSD